MTTHHRPSCRLFKVADAVARKLVESDLPALQDFFLANPDYFVAVTGMPPRADEARQAFDDRPPPLMPFDEVFLIGFVDHAGRLVAMATVVSNLMAEHVWQINLFMVATALHGSGTAALLYAGLEEWLKEQGARWIRLGAVVGNVRAERFWEKLGYAEVRRRPGTPLGQRVQTVRIFVKPLSTSGIGEYLQLVARDRPASPLP